MGLCGSNKQTTKVKIDPNIKASVDQLLGQISSSMGKPFTPYTGDLVAPTSQDTQTSYDMTRDFAAKYGNQPDLMAMLTNPSTIQQFMNPYQQGVIDVGLGEMDRQRQIMQKDVNASATGAGAFGDARHGVAEAETNRGVADMMQKFLAEQLAGGYDKAIGNIMALPGLTATQQGIEQKAISGLNAAGQQQEAKAQTGLDKQYEQFLRAQGWNDEQIKLFAQILGALPGGQTTTTTQPNSGVLGSLVGGLSSVLGGYASSPAGSAQLASMI